MEEVFRTIAAVTALGIEAAVIATVVLGAIEALVHLLRTLFTGSADNWTPGDLAALCRVDHPGAGIRAWRGHHPNGDCSNLAGHRRARCNFDDPHRTRPLPRARHGECTSEGRKASDLTVLASWLAGFA